MDLEALSAAIDELAGTDPAALADPDTVVEMHRLLARMAAVATRVSGCFDAGREWERFGARSAAAWLARRCGLPRSDAKREVALARSLRHLPACEEAWLAGDLGAAHVKVLSDVLRPATQQRLCEDEEMLVRHAKDMPFADFAKVVAYWAQHADPDGEDQSAAAQHEARRAHMSQSFDGLWFADAVLDALSGAVVSKELSRLESALFEADWAEARSRLGGEPGAADLARTPSQRRADALVEMAVRSGTAPAGGRRPEPLFSVLVGWETLRGRVCELANGTVVAPGALVPWLEEARLERVVFDSPSRVIDVGVGQRLFTGATRRAVEVRDRSCFDDFCDVTAERCEVDHVIPYSAGGETTQANGRLACGFHNRLRHRNSGPDP